MSNYDTLLAQVQAAIDLANSLTQSPDDNFANCVVSLIAARDALVVSEDRSAECLCQCHQGNPNWHALPCGCYTGDPYLG